MSRDASPSTAKSRTKARNCSCVPESRLQTASSHVHTQTAIACKTLPSSVHNQTPAAKQADLPRSVSIGMAPAGQFEEGTSRGEFFHSFSQASTQSRFVAAVGPSWGHGTVIRMRRLEKKTTTSTLRRDCLQQVGWPEVLRQHLGRLFSVEGAVSSIEATRDAVSTSLVFTNRADLQS